MAIHKYNTGDVLEKVELNGNFNSNTIKEVYTGTAFNTSANGGGTTTDTAEYELSEIAPDDLYNADYISIRVTSYQYANGRDASRNVHLNFYIKEIGGAYTLIYSTTLLSTSGYADSVTTTTTNEFVHKLTSTQKNSGVQIKVESISNAAYSSNSSQSAGFNNKCVVLELMNGI